MENERDYNIIDKNVKNPEERMRVLLFRKKNHLRVCRLLRRLWDLRNKLIKQEEYKNLNVQVNSAREYKGSLDDNNIPLAV